MINEERLKNTLITLCKIPSPSKSERKVIDYIKNFCVQNKIKFIEDKAGEKINGDSGNLIIFLEGKGKTILLNAHTDTVGDKVEINPIIEKNVIRSDGKAIFGADDKSGIAIILETIIALKENKIAHPPLEIVLSVSEEKGLLGMKNFDFSLIKAKLGLCLDSEGGCENIYVKAPSHDKVKINVCGKAAHAGVSPEKGINAIQIAAKAISEMKSGRIDEETTANIGIITGGRATNIVPDLVEIDGEARSHNEYKLSMQIKNMRDHFEEATKLFGGKVDFKVNREYNSFSLSEENEIVKLVMQTIKEIGLIPRLKTGGGGSDANILNSHGIPSVIIGTGMQNAHSKSEYLSLKEFYKTGEFLIQFVKNSGC